MLVAVTLLTGAWEWNARTNLGLHAGDIDDSPQAWAEARRAADHAPVAIVGDSRILFDTDQERFQAMTGVRPMQVAHVGTDARALLEHFANDPNFHGLLIVGMADTMYFGMPVIGLAAACGPQLRQERQAFAAERIMASTAGCRTTSPSWTPTTG